MDHAWSMLAKKLELSTAVRHTRDIHFMARSRKGVIYSAPRGMVRPTPLNEILNTPATKSFRYTSKRPPRFDNGPPLTDMVNLEEAPATPPAAAAEEATARGLGTGG